MKNFDSFGVMIDCSRNAVPSVAGLKRFFQMLSGMGYNCAMLYTEDTYEVKDEPYFWIQARPLFGAGAAGT